MGDENYERAYRAHINRWGVGATLRGAREAGGETIQDASQATRIRAEYLYALEAEEYQNLPGWAYALSYVRTYADYLGLEPLPLVRKVREQFELRQHTGFVPVDAEPPQRQRRRRIGLGIAAALAGIAAVGWYATDPASGLAEVFEPVPQAVKALINRSFFTVADSTTSSAERGQDEVLALSLEVPSGAPAGPPSLVARSVSPPDPVGTGEAPIAGSSGARFGALRDSPGPAATIATGTIPALVGTSAEAPSLAADAEIIFRARGPVSLTIEDAAGQVLLDQDLTRGQLYRVPNDPGVTVTADDAGALEVYVDGALAGYVGAEGSEVTRVPIDRLTSESVGG